MSRKSINNSRLKLWYFNTCFYEEPCKRKASLSFCLEIFTVLCHDILKILRNANFEYIDSFLLHTLIRTEGTRKRKPAIHFSGVWSILIIQRHEAGWKQQVIADSLGISRRTVCKWLARWRSFGEAGLSDSSSRPQRSPRKLAEAGVTAIVHLRRTFLMPAFGIAAQLGLAYSEILPDETTKSSLAFAKRAIRCFKQHGICVQRIMTDNGVGYKKCYEKILKRWGIKHITTKPYTPKTNGKAERFIRTSIEEWAYAQPYHHSNDRTEALKGFLDFYNNHRHHHAINTTPKIRCEQRLKT